MDDLSLNCRPPPALEVAQSEADGDAFAAAARGQASLAAVRAGVVQFLPNLLGFARSLESHHDQADDLVHDTVVRALAAATQFMPGTNVRAWLFTILHNQFLNQRRKPWARRVALPEFGLDEPATEATQYKSMEICDFRRAFLQLSDEQKEALLLIGPGNMDYEEAAVICGCAVGTVKSRVSRARSTLVALMDGGVLKVRRQDVPSTTETDFAQFLFGAVQGSKRGSATTRARKRSVADRSASLSATYQELADRLCSVGDDEPFSRADSAEPSRSAEATSWRHFFQGQ